MIKTIIVALHKRERESIALSLADSGDIKVIARGEDGYDALKLTGAMNPDIAILDADLGFIGGEEIPPLLKARSPSTAVVIVAGVIDDSRLFTAAVNGVSGFVRKETDMYMLPSILNCVFSGGCFISPLFAARLLRLLPSTAGGKTPSKAPPAGSAGIPRTRGDRAARFPPSEDPAGCLNKRELQILACIANGLSGGEIAGELHCAAGTVRNYVSAIMRKTGARSRTQMVCYACRFGVIPPRRE